MSEQKPEGNVKSESKPTIAKSKSKAGATGKSKLDVASKSEPELNAEAEGGTKPQKGAKNAQPKKSALKSRSPELSTSKLHTPKRRRRQEPKQDDSQGSKAPKGALKKAPSKEGKRGRKKRSKASMEKLDESEAKDAIKKGSRRKKKKKKSAKHLPSSPTLAYPRSSPVAGHVSPPVPVYAPGAFPGPYLAPGPAAFGPGAYPPGEQLPVQGQLAMAPPGADSGGVVLPPESMAATQGQLGAPLPPPAYGLPPPGPVAFPQQAAQPAPSQPAFGQPAPGQLMLGQPIAEPIASQPFLGQAASGTPMPGVSGGQEAQMIAQTPFQATAPFQATTVFDPALFVAPPAPVQPMPGELSGRHRPSSALKMPGTYKRPYGSRKASSEYTSPTTPADSRRESVRSLSETDQFYPSVGSASSAAPAWPRWYGEGAVSSGLSSPDSSADAEPYFHRPEAVSWGSSVYTEPQGLRTPSRLKRRRSSESRSRRDSLMPARQIGSRESILGAPQGAPPPSQDLYDHTDEPPQDRAVYYRRGSAARLVPEEKPRDSEEWGPQTEEDYGAASDRRRFSFLSGDLADFDAGRRGSATGARASELSESRGGMDPTQHIKYTATVAEDLRVASLALRQLRHGTERERRRRDFLADELMRRAVLASGEVRRASIALYRQKRPADAALPRILEDEDAFVDAEAPPPAERRRSLRLAEAGLGIKETQRKRPATAAGGAQRAASAPCRFRVAASGDERDPSRTFSILVSPPPEETGRKSGSGRKLLAGRAASTSSSSTPEGSGCDMCGGLWRSVIPDGLSEESSSPRVRALSFVRAVVHYPNPVLSLSLSPTLPVPWRLSHS